MKRLLWVFAIAILVAAGAACRPGADESVSTVDVERAAAALQPFKEQLVAALTDALGEGGPHNAIRVCRERAPEIAASLSIDGVRMGRSSHRLRNPSNAPAPWVESLVQAFLENPGQATPRAVRLDDSTFGYVEPIRMVSFCLSCHGPSIEPELEAVIDDLYPEDRATGFRVGDLRGVFWVTMPLSSIGS